jgi:hypothetical protein
MRSILIHNPKAGRGSRQALQERIDGSFGRRRASRDLSIDQGRKKDRAKGPSNIEITVKPSALVIPQPGRADQKLV